ncbi:hypothetical protein SCHPADRAFT_198499 [Schizopora paradoxa]|uniref:Uncharacterized protein n=1 Tax=Schizopora paradoxa TaxID=27342 RepID=A0A0H2S4Z0_9AGAM|nr:hypothetical protein SCHPADRAFT_198499 [Schizopora paradoxa]
MQADLKNLYSFQGHFTFDLHDLAAIVLRERQLSDRRFNRARLLEICEGETATAKLPVTAQPIWTSFKQSNKTGFCLGVEMNDAGEPPLEMTEFFDPEMRLPPGRAPLTSREKEMIYWRIRHHDSGYVLCEVLQQVLDSLPKDRTKLRIRTSQGHTLTELSPDAFHIAEVAMVPKFCTLTCVIQPRLEGYIDIKEHVFGGDLQPIPWVYLLFGDSSVADEDPAKDGRVMFDLVSPLLGMQGLGGELFSMERLADYHDRVLPTGGQEVINYNDPRSAAHEGYILSGRIQHVSSPELIPIIQDLATRVLKRLSRIAEGEESYCSYCGRRDSAVLKVQETKVLWRCLSDKCMEIS